MRERLFAFAACALLLGGCESYGDLTSDAFDPGNAAQSRFTLDSADCQAKAEIVRSYQSEGLFGSQTERHEIYNRAYTDCMKTIGYGRRDWSPDQPVPYSIDPFPG